MNRWRGIEEKNKNKRRRGKGEQQAGETSIQRPENGGLGGLCVVACTWDVVEDRVVWSAARAQNPGTPSKGPCPLSIYDFRSRPATHSPH